MNNENKIKFWRTTDKYGCFSNFSKHGFTYEGRYYLTSEHYYQSQKCLNSLDAENVIKAKTPKEAKTIANNSERKPNWEDIKYNIMKDALTLKFNQNTSLKEMLLSTNDLELIEDSPYDYIWGCGKDGTGLNLLGKCLMEVRSNFKKSTT